MTVKNPFPTKGRERYYAVMMAAEYLELSAFEGKADLNGYYCGSCRFYIHKKDSPTGAWCNKYQFPDRDYGCCDGYTPLPEIANP